MKKLICILLSLLLCVCIFAACGDKTNDVDDFSDNNIAETTNDSNDTLVVGENNQTMNHVEEQDGGHSANPSEIDNDNCMDNVINTGIPTPLQETTVISPTTPPTIAPAPTLPATATPPLVGEGIQGTENVVSPTPSASHEDIMNENDDSEDLGNGEDDPNDLGMF